MNNNSRFFSYATIVALIILSLVLTACINDDSDRISGVRLLEGDNNNGEIDTSGNENVPVEVINEPSAEAAPMPVDFGYALVQSKNFGNNFYVGQLGSCQSASADGTIQGGKSQAFLKSYAMSEYRTETTFYSCFDKDVFTFSVIVPWKLSTEDFVKYYIQDLKSEFSAIDMGMETGANGQKFIDAEGYFKTFSSSSDETIHQVQYIWHDDKQVFIFAFYDRNVKSFSAEQQTEMEGTIALFDLYKEAYPSTITQDLSFYD